MENKRCRRSIQMEKLTVVDTYKIIFKIRESNAGLIEVRIEDGQRCGWQLSTDISNGTQGLAQIRPQASPTGDTAAGW